MDIDKFYMDFLVKNNKTVFINNSDSIVNLNISDFDLAIIGIDFEEDVVNQNIIRSNLYDLYLPQTIKIIDLGNIIISEDFDLLEIRLNKIFNFIFSKNIPLLVLTNEKLINLSILKFYSNNSFRINYLSVSSTISFDNQQQQPNSNNYLNFSLSNSGLIEKCTLLGFQNFFVNPENLKIFEKNGNSAYRLSEVQADTLDFEPEFRKSDVINLDISSVKFSDAPGTSYPLPNGFTAQEICRLAHFSGLSDNLKVLTFSGYNNSLDISEVTAKLSGQILWHFISALNIKKKFNNISKDNLVNYYVKIDKQSEQYIKFVYCQKTERWWFTISNNNFEKIIPCSLKDYKNAKNGRLTERLVNSLKPFFDK